MLKKYQKTMAEKRKLLKSNRAPACRFSFFHIAAFAGKRVRRRGKRPQSETFIGTSEDPNEHGLVHVPRAHPFRSATSDVTMVSCRCNCDFKFVVRGYPSANQDDNAPIFKCDDSLLPTLLNVPRKLLETRMTETIRRCAYNIVAMHVASFNTDFYITKYATKPMEHLQNAISCLALGLKRLEVEEETGQQPFEEKYRAKRVTLRLAAASNRCAWVSTTELASTVLTEGHCWTSHNEIPLFLARAWFLINEAKRILQGSRGHMVEPASVPMDFVEIEMADVAERHADDAPPVDADDAPPLDADDVPQSDASDDESNGENFPVDGQRSHSGTDDEDPEDRNEPGTGVWKTATLKTTSSLHDDWLHRGPFLQSLSWFVYASRVRRVPKPKTLQKNMLHFPFDSHYLLAAMYCQTFSIQMRVPRLIGPHLPLPEEEEDHAAFMMMLFSTYHCQGVGCCTDPLNCRPVLVKANSTNNKHRFSEAWKARKAEITRHANAARVKTERSRKIPVVHDTTVAKQWWKTTATQCGHDLLQLTLMQMLVQKHKALDYTVYQLLLWLLRQSVWQPSRPTDT